MGVMREGGQDDQKAVQTCHWKPWGALGSQVEHMQAREKKCEIIS